MTQRSESFPIAIFIDASGDAAEYLEPLEKVAGLRWLLTHSLDVFRLLISEHGGDHVQLVVLDFRKILTEKLQYYMQVLRLDREALIPVLFLVSEDTQSRAERVIERDIDQLITYPFSPSELEERMGHMLGRSERRRLEVKFWIYLEERMIEGRTSDLSRTGMGGTIADPILFSRVKLRLFSPKESATVDLMGLVRRKHRLAEGGYQLGIEFQRIISGDTDGFYRETGVDFTHLGQAGEETLSELRAQSPGSGERA